MARNKQITGVQAAQIADELGRREPLKLLSSASESAQQIVAVTRSPVPAGKKAPPHVRKLSSRDDAVLAPTTDLEEHRTTLRRVFGETLSDEFVDVMLSKLVSVLRPGPFDQLDEGTLNAAIALIPSIQPKSELEAVIAAQIAAAAFASFKFLHHSQRHLDESFVGVYGGYATRLLRLQLELIQGLDKHRRGNQQTVRVEHVHIHAGAQGVVGIVNSTKRAGEGED